MAMGHQKIAERVELDCPKCGKLMMIGLMGHTWRSSKRTAYFYCNCGQERILVRTAWNKRIIRNEDRR